MTLLDKCKIMLITSITCLCLCIILLICSTRVINIKCFLCKGLVDRVSLIEYHTGTFKFIPCLHPVCASQISDTLAPNSFMTFGQWLEIRGWEPRHEELSNKTFDEILNN